MKNWSDRGMFVINCTTLNRIQKKNENEIKWGTEVKDLTMRPISELESATLINYQIDFYDKYNTQGHEIGICFLYIYLNRWISALKFERVCKIN